MHHAACLWSCCIWPGGVPWHSVVDGAHGREAGQAEVEAALHARMKERPLAISQAGKAITLSVPLNRCVCVVPTLFSSIRSSPTSGDFHVKLLGTPVTPSLHTTTHRQPAVTPPNLAHIYPLVRAYVLLASAGWLAGCMTGPAALSPLPAYLLLVMVTPSGSGKAWAVTRLPSLSEYTSAT